MSEPINALHIAAMRKADSIVFRHQNATSQIEASKNAKPNRGNPFGGEGRCVIPCDMRFSSYNKDVPEWRLVSFTGFEMIHYATSHGEWQTIVDLLRPGDTLQLHWSLGGMSTLGLTSIGWCGDKLALAVMRGKRKLTFALDQRVYPETSSARIIRDVELSAAEAA